MWIKLKGLFFLGDLASSPMTELWLYSESVAQLGSRHTVLHRASIRAAHLPSLSEIPTRMKE